MSQYAREPVGKMTAARFLAIYYRYAARFEKWRQGKVTDADVVALQKEEAARDVSI